MINKPLNQVSKADLQSLIDNAVGEGKTIEYKSELPLKMESQKIPFLGGFSAFANTIGGDMIFGIDAPDGIPLKIVGLDRANIDDDKLRLESSIRSGIEPKISHYEVHTVDLDESKYVLIFRIHRSWMAPHMVTSNNHSKFYGRSSAGKNPMDVSEIRRSILMSEIGGNKARNFREERVFKIAGNDTYVKLAPVGKFIVHIIPRQSISSDFTLGIKDLSNYENRPDVYGGWSPRSKINFDGILFHQSNVDDVNHNYLQWFRNGVLELVFQYETRNGRNAIPCIAFEREIISFVSSSLQKLKNLGVETPVYIFLSMMGFKGHTFAAEDFRKGTYSSNATESDFIIPEVEVANFSDDPSKILRPIFDTVWNAYGYKESLNYNTSGAWRPFNQD